MRGLLERVFEYWNAAQLSYVILRNYEELPANPGNDLDVLVDPGELERAQQLLQQAAGDARWRVHNVVEQSCRTVNLFDEETLEQLQVDLNHGLKWYAVPFLDGAGILRNRKSVGLFCVPDPVDEAAVKLMTRLIYGGTVKPAYRDGIRAVAAEQGEVLAATLAPWVGTILARELVAAAKQGRWPEIESLANAVRQNVLFANLRRPFQSIPLVFRSGVRLIRRWTHSTGVSVVFVGPDGSGKTSVAEALSARMGRTFHVERGRRFHWKPGPQRGGSAALTQNPHGRPTRGPVLSLAYWLYHLVSITVGWWVYAKPALFKNGLVTIDRYYYDLLVDQRRYRLNVPRWLVKLGSILVKQPDLVFCLDAPVETVQARKREVSAPEVARQREQYRALVSGLRHGHVVDAGQPLRVVVEEVQRTMLTYMAARARRRVPADAGHQR